MVGLGYLENVKEKTTEYTTIYNRIYDVRLSERKLPPHSDVRVKGALEGPPSKDHSTLPNKNDSPLISFTNT